MAFIRQLLTGILLFSLVAQSFSKMIVVVDFYVDQDYIARNLCVNRYNTAIRCGGQCELKKRLKQEDHKDSENPERRSDNKYEVISSRSFYLTDAAYYRPYIAGMYPPAPEGSPVDRPADHFHPPSC